MEGPDKKSISVEEYLRQTNIIKLVELKSGRTFEIKKIKVRDYLLEAVLPIETSGDIVKLTDEERGKKLLEKMTPEQKAGMKRNNDITLAKATISPPLTVDHEAGKLSVDDLTDDDYYELLTNVMEFSFGQQGDMRPFRQN